ncbi:MAG: exo-alpha-sialidase [Thermoguttaceae bacterium]|nr:exo-alpha-sialidase [Thermoguttaceae bacterium]
MRRAVSSLVLGLGLLFFCTALSLADGQNPPPGTVIDASSDFAKLHLGAPSMEILPDGTYVASHDWFEPKEMKSTVVFESKDQGATWSKIAEIPNQKAAMLFFASGKLWLIGWMYAEGDIANNSIVIRRSDDGGHTWSKPTDGKSGLLLSDRRYFCDPAPVLIHNGRVWKEAEAVGPREDSDRNWATGYQPLMMSAPVDSDLLDRDNWTFSNPVAWTHHPGLGGWLEGNALFDPDDHMLIMMRVDDIDEGGKAARLNLSDDFKTLSYDPKSGFVAMPGGCKKFVIRFDEVTKKYWSLVNWVHPDDVDAPDKERIRNTLALVCSDDLNNWEVRSIIYRHSDRSKGFQYVDWRIVGDDLHFVCRLAWDGAPNCHDSNYLTFDVVKNFRTRTRDDDAEDFAKTRK